MDSLVPFFETSVGRPFAALNWQPMSSDRATNGLFLARAEVDLVLKQLGSPAAAEREARGLGDWGPAAGWRVPKVIAADAKHRVIIMEYLGTAAAVADEDLDESVWLEAGHQLRQLHGLDLADDDAMSLREAWPRRLESSLKAAREVDLDRDLLRRVESDLADFRYPEGLERRPCHRDYRPRNWLRGGAAGDLAIIDFEQSRFDDPLVDFVRLLEDRSTPEARSNEESVFAAFLHGYGTALQDAEKRRLRALSLRHALDTLTWARRHGDVRFVTSAEARLRSLGI